MAFYPESVMTSSTQERTENWWSDERERQKQREREEFYSKINIFPNLFSLHPQFQNKHRLKNLLQKQQFEFKANLFQYHLERVRCQNLVVFLLFLLDKRTDALGLCKKNLPENERSIITLSNLAVLQWELGHRSESSATICKLEDLYKCSEYDYLLTVAKSEKAHALLRYGPKFFLLAMDLYHEVIDKYPHGNVFLWKYDLALSIRRNFNIFVYSEHPSFTASELAEKAAVLLKDVGSDCPNDVYKARSLIEKASLLSHLRSFLKCCKEDDKGTLITLCQEDHMSLVHQALESLQGKDDFYVYQIAGRLLKYDGQEKAAIEYLHKAQSLRDDGIVCQLLGKTYLSYSRKTGSTRIGTPEELKRHCSWPPDGAASPAGGLLPAAPADCCNRPADPEAGWEAGQSTYGSMSPEEYHKQYHALEAQFDQSAAEYLNEDGSLRGTTPSQGAQGVWNFYKSDEQTTERKMIAAHLAHEYDESVLINNDGTFKPQETECVGNIRKHKSESRWHKKPPYKGSHSFPPVSERKRMQGTTDRALKCLLKCAASGFSLYDETNIYVQKAKVFFDRGLQLDPNNMGLLYDMGRMLQGLNKPEEALKYFQKITFAATSSDSLMLVNAYEQSGLCLLKLSDQPGKSAESPEQLVSRAEEMFMQSLQECRRAVHHMPGLSTNRASLWSSYSEMLGILKPSSGEIGAMKKAARVHELVGKYLEAIKVYQEVLAVSKSNEDRKKAIFGLVKNHYMSSNVKDARFILDLLMNSDERQIILEDHDVTCDLRSLAVFVYSSAAKDALQSGLLREAQLCFSTVFLIKGMVSEEKFHICGSDDELTDGRYEVCIFDDEEYTARHSMEEAEKVSQVSSTLKKIMHDVFGMSTSLNDGGVLFGHLQLTGELKLAETAGTVVFVLPSWDHMSPRMSYLADAALQSVRPGRILPVVVGDPHIVPDPLKNLPQFSGALDLLEFKGEDIDANVLKMNSDIIYSLFQYTIGNAHP